MKNSDRHWLKDGVFCFWLNFMTVLWLDRLRTVFLQERLLVVVGSETRLFIWGFIP